MTFPMRHRRCPPSISCANCALGRRCYFAEMAGSSSVPLDPPRAFDDGLYRFCGMSEGEGHGAPRFLPSDEPEE